MSLILPEATSSQFYFYFKIILTTEWSIIIFVPINFIENCQWAKLHLLWLDKQKWRHYLHINKLSARKSTHSRKNKIFIVRHKYKIQHIIFLHTMTFYVSSIINEYPNSSILIWIKICILLRFIYTLRYVL